MQIKIDYATINDRTAAALSAKEAAWAAVTPDTKKNSKLYRAAVAASSLLEQVRAAEIIDTVLPQLRSQFPTGIFTIERNEGFMTLNCSVEHDAEFVMFRFIPNAGLNLYTQYHDDGPNTKEEFAGTIRFKKPGYGWREISTTESAERLISEVLAPLALASKQERAKKALQDLVAARSVRIPYFTQFQRSDTWVWRRDGQLPNPTHFEVSLVDDAFSSRDNYFRLTAEDDRRQDGSRGLAVAADVRFILDPEQAAEFMQEIETLYRRFGQNEFIRKARS